MRTVFFVMVMLGIMGCNSLLINDEDDKVANGKILFSLSEDDFLEAVDNMYETQKVWTQAMENIDTNNFNLSVYTQQGSKIYKGKYGERPREMVVVPGAYDIRLSSDDLKAPAFDSPVYGDVRTILVEENSSVAVKLTCRQLNSGVRLNFSIDFLAKYPGKGLILRDSKGEIVYPYISSGFCYVEPGKIELLYDLSNNVYIPGKIGEDGVTDTLATKDTLLFTRDIEAAQMLTLNLSFGESGNTASLRMDIDTTRDWVTENFDVALKVPTGVLTIEQAKKYIGQKNVMVFGFIFGGDATETSIRVGPPFKTRTNIVIAPSMDERRRDNMFVVELPSGEIREALNLVANSKLLGSAVVITGNIVEKYFGYPGIKSTKAYSILY